MHLPCTSISEEGGDGEVGVSEALSLLSYTLRYVSLKSADTEALSLLAYTLRYVRIADFGSHGRSVGLFLEFFLFIMNR